MFKIAILTAIYGRLPIVETTLKGFRRLQTYRPSDFEIRLFAAVSSNEEVALCEKYQCSAVKVANHPLGLKWNEGLMLALNYDFDFVLISGSDNILTPSILDLYADYMDFGVFGVDQMYAYDLNTGQVKHFTGYPNHRMSLGAGRMISREAIHAVRYKLWRTGINRGLDGSMIGRLASFGIGETIIPIENHSATIVDLKSDFNINSFGSLAGNIVPSNDLFSRLTPQGIKDIRALRQLNL